MTDLLSALKAHHPASVPMHMPGHMRNEALFPYLKELGAKYDITEITGFDDLHNPEGILLESMKRAASLWGSDETRCLIGGSTCGIVASVYALLSGGGRALCARNAHKSLYHALEITGAQAVFLPGGFDEETGEALMIDPCEVEKALDENEDIRFVFIVSPTYEGVISDVESICRIAHKRNIPVIVDEAHGAHLDLFGAFPGGAVRAGADIVIQSLHKTLASLTQTAIMHINGNRVDVKSIDHALDIFETSSPSYLLMASVDGCVRLLEDKGDEILSRWKKMTLDFRKKAEKLKNIRVYKPGKAFLFDDSKLILTCDALSGAEIKDVLRDRFSIELEAAYARYAIAMTGAGTTEEMLKKLLDALFIIDEEVENAKKRIGKAVNVPLPKAVMTARAALQTPYECVRTENALGRVAAEYQWAYPPGVPVVAPGEVIDEGVLCALKELTDFRLNLIRTRSGEGEIAVLLHK